MLRVVFNILFGWMCKKKTNKVTEEQQQTPGKTRARSRFPPCSWRNKSMVGQESGPGVNFVLYFQCIYELFRELFSAYVWYIGSERKETSQPTPGIR